MTSWKWRSVHVSVDGGRGKVLEKANCLLFPVGLISPDEFRKTWKIFSSYLGIYSHDEAIDKLAQSIDYNKDGYIDFNEFLEAFHVVRKLENKAA